MHHFDLALRVFVALTSGRKTRDSGSNPFKITSLYLLRTPEMVTPKVSRFPTRGQGNNIGTIYMAKKIAPKTPMREASSKAGASELKFEH